jgi:hypothetical protein
MGNPRVFHKGLLHGIDVHVIDLLACYFSVIHRCPVSPSFPEMILPITLCALIVFQFRWILPAVGVVTDRATL